MTVTPRDAAKTLLRRYRNRRLEVDARVAELRAVVTRLAPKITERHRRAWLIGSLATGRLSDASDVDIVVEGLSDADATALWTTLEHELARPVDLLHFEHLDTKFQERIMNEGVPLHVA